MWFLLLFSLGLRWPFASMLSFGGARVVFAAAFRLLLVFACPLLALLGFLPWFGPTASAAVVPVLCAPLGARFQTGLAPAMFKNDRGHFSLV